jgi:hypothetical protein
MIFGGILASNPMAQIMVPKLLGGAHRRLLTLAAKNPDLRAVYKSSPSGSCIFDPASAVRAFLRRGRFWSMARPPALST